jgi:hypothetical protein
VLPTFAKQLVYEKQNVCYTSIHGRIEARVAMALQERRNGLGRHRVEALGTVVCTPAAAEDFFYLNRP